MPSVNVAASPGYAVLITVTSFHCLYVCIDHFVRSLDFDQSENQTQLAIFEVGGANLVLPRTSGRRTSAVSIVAQTPNVKISGLVD